MKSNQLNPHTIDVNNAMILAVTSFSSKYKIHCEDN